MEQATDMSKSGCDGHGLGHDAQQRAFFTCHCTVCLKYLVRLRLECALVPPRYLDASLDALQPENELQAAALPRLIHYTDTWSEQLKLGAGVGLFSQRSRVGKTHMGVGIMRRIAEKYPVRPEYGSDHTLIPMLFINVSTFIGNWRNYYARPNQPAGESDSQRWSDFSRLIETEKRAHITKLLVLDDLGEVSATEFASKKIYELVEYRVSNNLPIIFTTNLTWDELARRYGESGARVVGRLQEVTADHTIQL
jgi:DNA replication protein DnaC